MRRYLSDSRETMVYKEGDQVMNSLNLRFWPRVVAVSFVHHFNADRKPVDISAAVEVHAGARMPSLAKARNMLIDCAVSVNREMAADSRFTIVEPGYYAFDRVDLSMVKDDCVDDDFG